MDTVLDIARSGLTVTMTPAQLLVAVGLLGVAFASNAKSLVFAWHGRLFAQLARHFLLQRPQLTVKSDRHGAESLFAPVVTTSYTPLLDIDYNMHKSNSTFFNDLDDNRTELMLALFKAVVKPEQCGKNTVKAKMFNLGGTSCIFKKPIAPFARYEISSRILCWDQKWIYVVSHFTNPGSNTATHFLLAPPAKASHSRQSVTGNQEDSVYATSITKYVFKKGRVTCTPESIMDECGLLPPRTTPEGLQDLEPDTSNTKKQLKNHWSWEQVQEECTSHLEVAQNFGALDQLHSTFVGHSGPALYKY